MRKKDDDKQQSIKNAVIEVILAEGIHGASISKIAKKANVSPATIYIYYENKELMLNNIYKEYSSGIYDTLLNQVNVAMKGSELIEILILNYYNYIRDNHEIYSFVEQFTNCPSLMDNCQSSKRGACNIQDLLRDMKDKQIVKDFRDDNLFAIMFYPVKAIAQNHYQSEQERMDVLQEMIDIISGTVLR